MTPRKPKASPTQHAAQAPIRKAKREANQQRADARLWMLLEFTSYVPDGSHNWRDDGTGTVNYHGYIREYPFMPPRLWKFDCAFPAEKIAIEVEGGQWQITGRDQTREAERHNAATLGGWLVLHFTSAMIDTDVAGCAELLRQAFAMREKVVVSGNPDGDGLMPLGFLVDVRSKQTPISGSAAISTRRHQ